MEKEKNLFICGDIHGRLKELVWNASEKYKLEDCNIIVAGDFGVGFGKPGSMNALYDRVRGKLEKHNINILAIRGNHDDPSYFTGEKDYEHLKFLPDYKVLEISGRKILPIGGAVSIDQEIRIKENKKQEHYDTEHPKKYWWPGEDVKRLTNFNSLPRKVDIIISHEAPLSFPPVFLRGTDWTYELYEKILNSRQYLDEILGYVNTDYWFYGHYHKHESGSLGKLMYRCLEPLELYDASDH